MMAETDATYRYDAFISYSHKDAQWVQHWLVPKLEAQGLKIAIDYRDFEVGRSSMVNMERAVANSRHTVLVLTPNWVNSQYSDFEALLVQTDDPNGLQRRLLPLMLEPCVPPKRISILTYADFRDKQQWEDELPHLIAAIQDEETLPERRPPVPPPSLWPKVVVGLVVLVVLLGLLWYVGGTGSSTYHIVAVIPSARLFQELPASGDPSVVPYTLYLQTSEDTFVVNDLRKSMVFAGLDKNLEQAFENPEPALYDGLLLPEAGIPDDWQVHYKALMTELHTSRLEAGDAITVRLMKDATLVSTGTGVIRDADRVTSIILQPKS